MVMKEHPVQQCGSLMCLQWRRRKTYQTLIHTVSGHVKSPKLCYVYLCFYLLLLFYFGNVGLVPDPASCQVFPVMWIPVPPCCMCCTCDVPASHCLPLFSVFSCVFLTILWAYCLTDSPCTQLRLNWLTDFFLAPGSPLRVHFLSFAWHTVLVSRLYSVLCCVLSLFIIFVDDNFYFI